MENLEGLTINEMISLGEKVEEWKCYFDDTLKCEGFYGDYNQFNIILNYSTLMPTDKFFSIFVASNSISLGSYQEIEISDSKPGILKELYLAIKKQSSNFSQNLNERKEFVHLELKRARSLLS